MLTSAITKVFSGNGKTKFMKYDEIDRAEEERARGITINACHVDYYSSGRHYAHTDCPGHIDYIKNMITGAAQMDVAVLVVAASEGVMPQTTEHILLAKQIGIKNIIVYLNKVDIVDEDTLELVELEVRELLDNFGYDSEAIPIIPGSALDVLNEKDSEWGTKSIMKLIDALDRCKIPTRDTKGPFRLPIEKAVTVPGRGTVAIGTISKGNLKKSQEVRLMGRGVDIKTIASDIQVFHQSVSKATAGENVGVLLRGLRKDIVQRGMFLSQDDSLSQTDTFEAQIYVQTKEEGGRKVPLMNNYVNQIYMENWDIACMVKLAENVPMIMPGDTALCKMILRLPMVLEPGQRFFIREGTITALTGIISKILPKSEEKYAGFNYLRPKAMKIEGKSAAASRRRRKK
ncbi:DgyrCDS11226 [Dimorphilus gyrociliatus]|nr:DgyrCDS11226 [Dimorphilus gyrociliatus]